jgi:hypothetical protein
VARTATHMIMAIRRAYVSYALDGCFLLFSGGPSGRECLIVTVQRNDPRSVRTGTRGGDWSPRGSCYARAFALHAAPSGAWNDQFGGDSINMPVLTDLDPRGSKCWFRRTNFPRQTRSNTWALIGRIVQADPIFHRQTRRILRTRCGSNCDPHDHGHPPRVCLACAGCAFSREVR